MADTTWDELSSLTGSLERLRLELERCVGADGERDRLQREIDQLDARRARLIDSLCEAVPAQVAEPRQLGAG